MSERPCECCKQFNADTPQAYWAVDGCDCHNLGDTLEAQVWCTEQNVDARIATLEAENARLAKKQAYLNKHHEITETAIGVARLKIKDGDPAAALEWLDKACRELEVIDPLSAAIDAALGGEHE